MPPVRIALTMCALFVLAVGAANASAGNSAAVKQCQKNGWQSVRGWAAAHALEFAPADGEPVLERLAGSPEAGLVGVLGRSHAARVARGPAPLLLNLADSPDERQRARGVPRCPAARARLATARRARLAGILDELRPQHGTFEVESWGRT